MALFRTNHDKNNPYIIVNRTIVTDARLSAKAKGIWLYAFSRPDDWEFYSKEIEKHFTDGREAIASGLKELEECGYLHRHQPKSESGKYDKTVWDFFETPKTNEEIKKLVPQTGFTYAVNPDSADPHLLNKDRLSKEVKSVTGGNPPEVEEANASEVEEANASEVKENEEIPNTITIRGRTGNYQLNQSDLFRKALKLRADIAPKELIVAWSVLAKYEGTVYDWWKFIEGTVENQRKRAKSERIVRNGKGKGKVRRCNIKKRSTSTLKSTSERDTETRTSPNTMSLYEMIMSKKTS